MFGRKTDSTEQKDVKYGRLLYEALPEMWTFKLVAAIILFFPAFMIRELVSALIGSAGTAYTTANLRSSLTWRILPVLALGFLLVMMYLVVEILMTVCLTDDILNGRQTTVTGELKRSIRGLVRFMTPSGLLVILYILIAVPLGGIGFSLSLTKAFRIPNFIMDVILDTPAYTVLYWVLVIVLMVIGFRFLYTIHAVVIDEVTPREGLDRSAQLMKQHGGQFIRMIIGAGIRYGLVLFLVFLVFRVVPFIYLTLEGQSLPHPHYINILEGSAELTDTDGGVIIYRTACALVVLMGSYIVSVAALLVSSCLTMRMTRFYLERTRGERDLWPERPKRALYIWKVLMAAAVFVGVFALSLGLGLFYNQIFDRETPVRIIAHRAGGTLASENSLEGIDAAVEHACYGSEIDIQRTRDGYYIINHDSTFKRLSGVDRAPQDMTLEEIRELRISDTTGSGRELPVATLEEMLEASRGRIRLFVELKGATADERMVDDTVRIAREMDCLDNIVLISLNYDVIDYAETHYPEVETGTLFFAGIGNPASLNCDLLIMEEEMATTNRVSEVHDAGKQVIVWTVNSDVSMRYFLDSSVDAVITDEILRAEEVQGDLDRRTDIEVMSDGLSDSWK